jgi:hypothetical protein
MFEPELWSPLARDGDRGAQSRHGAARRSYGRAAKSAVCGCACLHVCVRRGAVGREGVCAARGRGEGGRVRRGPWKGRVCAAKGRGEGGRVCGAGPWGGRVCVRRRAVGREGSGLCLGGPRVTWL